MQKRELIIREFVRDSNQTLDDIAFKFETSKEYVSAVLTEYSNIVVLSKPLWLVKQIKGEDWYLFDDTTERKVLVEDGDIVNKIDFTEYELFWMQTNYKLGVIPIKRRKNLQEKTWSKIFP